MMSEIPKTEVTTQDIIKFDMFCARVMNIDINLVPLSNTLTRISDGSTLLYSPYNDLADMSEVIKVLIKKLRTNVLLSVESTMEQDFRDFISRAMNNPFLETIIFGGKI